MVTSEFIYVNAPIPKDYAPPQIVRVTSAQFGEVASLLVSNDVSIEPAVRSSPAECILSVFEHVEVLLGDPRFIPERRALWLDKLSRFTDSGKPVHFLAMAFPYKVPNPLKTGQRRAPDLGEGLMLRRFAAILAAVQRCYQPGARLTLLEEGILGRCQGVDPADIAAYRAGISQVFRLADLEGASIAFHSLDDMVNRIDNFEARWYMEQERLRRLWEEEDPYVRRAYQETFPGQRSTVPTRDYNPVTLAEALDPAQGGSALRYVHEYLDTVAHRQFFAYRALINLRDASGYLEGIVPGGIKLTVAPKPTNLAVIPINRHTNILPYHGAPIVSLDGAWSIDYFGNLGTYGPLEAIHLSDDADPAPIAYRMVSE